MVRYFLFDKIRVCKNVRLCLQINTRKFLYVQLGLLKKKKNNAQLSVRNRKSQILRMHRFISSFLLLPHTSQSRYNPTYKALLKVRDL